MLRKGLTFSFFIFFYLVLTLIDVSACRCFGPRTFGGKHFQSCGVYWGSEVVFTGRVEKITFEKVVSATGTDYSQMVAHFLVDKPIRGVEGNSIDIETSASTASCGYPFKEGESYFVYVRKGADGKLTQHLCDPTVLLKDAEPDFEYLKAIEAGEKGARVYGTISRWVQTSFKDSISYAGLAGVNIRLTSVKVIDTTRKDRAKYIKRTFETKTDQDGSYMFMGIPNGMYNMKAVFPKGLRELTQPDAILPKYVTIDSDRRRCGNANFMTTSLASLDGRVVNQDGSTPLQQYIWLLPTDESGKVLLDYYAYTWILNGKYHFDTVAPGNYVLAVNPKGCPNKYYAPQYGSTFFPGVSDPLYATKILVKESEIKKAEDLRLLPTLKERLFTGVVLTSSGTPASGAKVFLNEGNVNKCMVLSSLDEAVTNDAGEFKLKGYEGFEYKLRAYIEGKNGNSDRLMSDLIDILAAKDSIADLHLTLSHQY